MKTWMAIKTLFAGSLKAWGLPYFCLTDNGFNDNLLPMARQKHPPFLFELFCILQNDTHGQTDIARELLINSGVKPEDVIVVAKAETFRVVVYFNNCKKADLVRAQVNQHLKGAFRFKVKKIKNENWKVKTAKIFSVFALTNKFDIVPSWKQKSYRRTPRMPIIIDSINAFGTGLHETTSFMAKLIERREGRFQSFLDIGTGTGLLAMIALKCGARHVWAIDFDPEAVVAAKQNLKVNGYSQQMVRRADIRCFHAPKRFDFVAANLITRDLIKYKRQILSTVEKNGFLAISGIMIENLSLLRKAFGIKKLRCVKVHKGAQWVALLYKRIL